MELLKEWIILVSKDETEPLKFHPHFYYINITSAKLKKRTGTLLCKAFSAATKQVYANKSRLVSYIFFSGKGYASYILINY